jgi:hypothetical protein
MTKEERLEYMRKRFPQLKAQSDIVLSVNKSDIEEELGEMVTFGEYQKEKKINVLTSDEIPLNRNK